MNEVEQLRKIIGESNNIVFLAEPEFQRKVGYRISEV